MAQASRSERVAASRPRYVEDLARGVEGFFEPRLAACPWCASLRLRRRVRTIDRIQRKPGVFVLDECRGCGHVFQNPRLSQKGLEFYYRDFYDGLGEEGTRRAFAVGGQIRLHRRRAASVRPYARPGRWLDVGTGHGHFCEAAREVLPGTVFDGLDWGEGVDIAAREGRIVEAHRGSFIELAGRLADRYDAVSMYHYLEHTLDPRQDLAAAHQVLRPGGHLLIEIPDPESLAARLLGRWWSQWIQPQHLHLMPLANLSGALREAGFTVVATDRREPHLPIDLSAALVAAIHSVVPTDDVPWVPYPPGTLSRGVRVSVFLAAAPAIIALYGLDQLIAPVARRTRLSNAYRVIARRD